MDTSAHQGTPSTPFFPLFHSWCRAIAESTGTVLPPAWRASRAAFCCSSLQLKAERAAPAGRARLSRRCQSGSRAKRDTWRAAAT